MIRSSANNTIEFSAVIKGSHILNSKEVEELQRKNRLVLIKPLDASSTLSEEEEYGILQDENETEKNWKAKNEELESLIRGLCVSLRVSVDNYESKLKISESENRKLKILNLKLQIEVMEANKQLLFKGGEDKDSINNP